VAPEERVPVAVAFEVDDGIGRRRFLDDVAPQLLESLDPNAKPAWGGMSAQQMVEHLAWVFDISTGAAQVACDVPEEARRLFKAFLYNTMQSPRNIMNPALVSGLPPLRWPSLTGAIAEWNAAKRRFNESPDSSGSATYVHPLLGPLNHEEWSRFHFKHIFHHLLQFGLVAAV
jgi:oxepin-CoA hydrolase/3-oxo-5,6-dehydrosuberyl-CoA semialdehyde dehydrogenase